MAAFLPQLVAWLRAPITGDLLEVPGIDDSHAVEKLAGANIETTHQLIGHYLMHKGNGVDAKAHAQAFDNDLQARGTPNRAAVANAVGSKTNIFLPGVYAFDTLMAEHEASTFADHAIMAPTSKSRYPVVGLSVLLALGAYILLQLLSFYSMETCYDPKLSTFFQLFPPTETTSDWGEQLWQGTLGFVQGCMDWGFFITRTAFAMCLICAKRQLASYGIGSGA